MKVYLDACALNRLTDDPSDSRIKAEAEAVEQLLRRIDSGAIQWVGSTVLQLELSKNPNWDRRQESLDLLLFAVELYVPSTPAIVRARELESLGFGSYDALHLACAEDIGADVFITTDDRLLRRARRGIGNLSVRAMNPLEFL
jgi:predicted nucleic acid-binding protein